MKIDINNITMIYPSGKKALLDITVSLESPGFIGILGPNGAGKTTLMKLLIAGLIPTKGEIMLDRKRSLNRSSVICRRASVSMTSLPYGNFWIIWRR